MTDIGRIRQIYANIGAPIEADTLDGIRSEVDRVRRFARIPTVEEVLGRINQEKSRSGAIVPCDDKHIRPSVRHEAAEEIAAREARAILRGFEIGRTNPAAGHGLFESDRPGGIKGSLRLTVRRPEWILNSRAVVKPDGTGVFFEGYGHTIIGPAYEHVVMRGIAQGDVIMALAAPHAKMGALMRLPPADQGMSDVRRLFLRIFGSRNTDILKCADKNLLEHLAGPRCPYTLEAYYLSAAFARFGLKDSELRGSLIAFDAGDASGGGAPHPALIQQFIGALHAMNVPVHDIRLIAVPHTGVDAVLTPASPRLSVAGLDMMRSETPITFQPVIDAALSFRYGLGYFDTIPPDQMMVRRRLLPTAAGLWGGDHDAFQAGVLGIRQAMGLPTLNARITALAALNASWRAQIPLVR